MHSLSQCTPICVNVRNVKFILFIIKIIIKAAQANY